MNRTGIIAIVAAGTAMVLAAAVAIVALPLAAIFFFSSSSTSCTTNASAAVSSGDTTITASTGTKVTLSAKQMGYIATVVSIGTQEGVTAEGLTAAIAAGLTESGMRNLANPHVAGSESYANDGLGQDHDSVNPWQMRANWGTVAERMNITYAVKAWFGGPNGPNHGTPAGLLDIPNWQSLDAATLAQEVEVSAYPDRYAKWVPAAKTLINDAGGARCADASAGVWKAPNGKTGADVAEYARQFVGKVPYGNDCGSAGKPSGAWCCTGFVYWVYHTVLGIDLTSTVVSGQLAQAHQIPQSQAQAGDLVAWVGYHIGIYDGNGHVIAAADWGEGTKISPLPFTIGGVAPTYWRVNAIGAGTW